MPFASLVIDYLTEGDKVRQYTFGIKETRSGSSNQPIDTAFWNLVRGARVQLSNFAYTDPTASTAGTPLSVLEAILRFLRALHGSKTTFIKAYLSDGVTPGPSTGPFATAAFSLPGKWSHNYEGDPPRAEIAPANQTLMLQKSPVVMGVRQGHQFLRFVLRDKWLTYGSQDGTTMDSSAMITNMDAAVQAATLNATLNTFFAGVGDTASKMYFGQLQYYSVLEVLLNPSLKNAIKAVQAISGWSAIDANERAAQRGKKRKPSAAAAARVLMDLGLTIDADEVRELEIARRTPLDTGVRPSYDDSIDAEPDPDLFGARPPEVAYYNGDIDFTADVDQVIPGLSY